MRTGDVIRKHKRVIIVLGGALFALLALSSLFGGLELEPAAGPDEGRPIARAEFGAGGAAFKIIGSVALLVGLLYGGVYVMRRFSGGMGGRGFKPDAIAVLHKRPIAPKKAIYVVKVGTKTMVVGVTDSQISHLADLSDDELESLTTGEKEKTGDFKKHFLGLAFGIKDRT